MNVATNIDKRFNELYLSFRMMPNSRGGLGGLGELSGLGEFGAALGEIASLEAYSTKLIMDETRAGLGELRELALTIDEAKAQLSQALNLKAQVDSARARFDRLTQKLARAKNETVRTRIQGLLSKAKPLIDAAAAGAAGIEATIASMTDFLKQAGVVVEAAKEKVLQTAEAAKKGATEAIQKAKELAIRAGELVKEKAAAVGKIAMAAAEAAKQKALQAAAAAKAAAEQKVAQAKALAQQVAAKAQQAAQAAAQRVAQARAQAQAVAQAAAQRVQQAAAQAQARAQQLATQARAQAQAVVQRAQQTVAPVVQRVQQAVQTVRSAPASAVSRVKSFFGLRGLSGQRGLSGLGIAPVLLAAGAAAAVGGALLAANTLLGQGESLPDTTAVTDLTTAPTPPPLSPEAEQRIKEAMGIPPEGELPTGVPGVDYPIQLPTGGGCFSLSTGLPEPCRPITGTPTGYMPEGGYTPGLPLPEQPPTGGYYSPETGYVPPTYTPGAGVMPTGEARFAPSEGGYAPGEMPTPGAEVPGAAPGAYPGYEPGAAPEFAPSAPSYAPEYQPTPGYEPEFTLFEQPSVPKTGVPIPTAITPEVQPSVPSVFDEFEVQMPFVEPTYPQYVTEPQYPGVTPTAEPEKIEDEYFFGDKLFDIFGSEPTVQPSVQTTGAQSQSKSFFDTLSELGL